MKKQLKLHPKILFLMINGKKINRKEIEENAEKYFEYGFAHLFEVFEEVKIPDSNATETEPKKPKTTTKRNEKLNDL